MNKSSRTFRRIKLKITWLKNLDVHLLNFGLGDTINGRVLVLQTHLAFILFRKSTLGPTSLSAAAQHQMRSRCGKWLLTATKRREVTLLSTVTYLHTFWTTISCVSAFMLSGCSSSFSCFFFFFLFFFFRKTLFTFQIPPFPAALPSHLLDNKQRAQWFWLSF